ncbi:MAG: hypothetical protein JWL90_3812 [Chthoniobacteraceae bacterium]|nr:hypothetical protein [Chthoniobacteraceae bacterium]
MAFALAGAAPLLATPSNKAALERHYERFLEKNLARCTTCHLPSDIKEPESLDDFPHNAFGNRLRILGEELDKAGKPKGIATRLALIAQEDSDGDGVANEIELLLGKNPGDSKQTPAAEEIAGAQAKQTEFARFIASYRWQPFERVQRPALPAISNPGWVRTPIDAFIAAAQEEHGLKPRPEAPKSILLRRVYLDLIGLSPTPEEQRAFASDPSPDAYEKVVDRLLESPQYGERWGRHWMDIWRYSDWAGWTDGKQVRDSQRHIWRWRDWIVESLNADHGYDQMVVEMLAADELAPNDPETLRATGFLVRNYKMLSREQWLEDTVKHTSQAFLGITLGCAKCHDHRTDPISQAEYYQVRAIFEPHQVRTDRVPGVLDREKDGVPRVYDIDKDAPTYFFIRGDERRPDKDRVMQPGVPRALCGDRLKPALDITRVALPADAASPDKRDFVIRDTLLASEQLLLNARDAFTKAKTANQITERKFEFAIAEARHTALLAEIRAEQIEAVGNKSGDDWKEAAEETMRGQNEAALFETELGLYKLKTAQADARQILDDLPPPTEAEIADPYQAKREKAANDLKTAEGKIGAAEQAFAKAGAQANGDATTGFKPRPKDDYPAVSTGRRLAFAKWLVQNDNPLTARVAMNHLWLRHFGRGIVATPENFGFNGARASHPALLDWLAAEFMANGWKMKPMHRMLVTSNTYRMASTPDAADLKLDTDNLFLWRMPTRRMEAELVRDNLLYVAGSLDLTRGGADIDQMQGLTSKRRSLYLRSASEKEVEFLKIFDGPSVNECYQRHPSVMPQQSLALANSELTLAQSQVVAKRLSEQAGANAEAFVRQAFERVLSRIPSDDELGACLAFLNAPSNDPAQAPDPMRLRENLILVLFNHNDFITIR